MTSAESTGDFTGYRDKAATDLQTRFQEWIKDKLAMTFASKKEEAAFDEGVRLAVALRMPFQRSPENQAVSPLVRGNREAAAEAPAPAPAKKAAAKAVPAPAPAPAKAAPAKKVAKAAKATAAPAPEEPEAEAEEEAPAATPAKRTGQRPARRTRAAATTASAPF